MKITMFVNYADPQILPFARTLAQETEGNFTLAATEPFSKDLLAFGYPDTNEEPYVVRLYETAGPLKAAASLAETSDALIYAHCPGEYFDLAVRSGKPVFRFSQHIYRNGDLRHIPLKMKASYYLKHTVALKHKPVYLMCIGTYTAQDFSLTGSYEGRMFEFGEFPELLPFDFKPVHEKPCVLWANDFIPSAHPEVFPDLVRTLPDPMKHSLEFVMAGHGELLEGIRRDIEQSHLPIRITVPVCREDLHEVLKNADIYVMSSDYHEGWGNTLNLAMNFEAAPVVSTAVGSNKLIDPFRTGMLYEYGNTEALRERIEELAGSPEKTRKMGQLAAASLKKTWNGEVGARRFLRLAEALASGRPSPFEEGLCRRAEIITQKDRILASRKRH
ncbi:MAG: glycosyltransferase family 4 protein [Solobacterium sp.]|nr:glycosyltransferase family 4 protein [Solobacterium sp.]